MTFLATSCIALLVTLSSASRTTGYDKDQAFIKAAIQQNALQVADLAKTVQAMAIQQASLQQQVQQLLVSPASH